jgi:hexokinase
VGADGSVFTKYPRFGARLQTALVEIFGEERGRNIVMKGAEDGSGSVINLFSPQTCAPQIGERLNGY